MLSITSICLTLCLVVIVTASPQGIRARPEDASEDNEITEHQHGLNGTDLSESSSENDNSNFLDDEELEILARVLVGLSGGHFNMKTALYDQPENKRVMLKRQIMDVMVYLKLLSDISFGSEENSKESSSTDISEEIMSILMDALEKAVNGGSEETEEKTSSSAVISESTELKIKQALVNAVIGPLELKPCLKEFVEAMLEDGGINDAKIRGTTCDASTIYTSQWYQSSCREVMENSSEEDEEYVVWWCGAPFGEEEEEEGDNGK